MGIALRAVAPPGMRRAGVRALSSFVGAYAVLVAVVSLVTATPEARPLSGQALLGGAVLATLSAGPALLRALLAASRRPASSVLADGVNLPPTLRRAVPATIVALGAWLAAGAVAAAAALVAGHERVLALHQALDPGALGGAALTLSQLALAPVAVLWGAAWVAGPGFVVGAGSSITPAATALGPLPAFPLLGGLPEPGAHHPAMVAVLALPVLAGVLAGWYLRRGGGRQAPVRRDLVDTVVVALLSGAAAGLLAGLASGPAGPGRMAEVGPPVGLVALAVAVEVAAGCVAAVLLLPRGSRGQPGWVGKRVSSATRSSNSA